MGEYFTDIPDGSAVALDKPLIQSRLQSLDDAIVGIYNADASSDGIQQTKLLAPSTLTISGDAITRAQEWHRIDTESAAASDNLQTISGGVDGMKLIIQTVSAARVVTVLHNSGNIYLMDGLNRVMNDPNMALVLLYSVLLGKWIQIDGTGYLSVRETIITTPVPTAQIQLPDRVLIGSTTRQRRWAIMPSFEASNWFGLRAAAATIQPMGVAAPTITGTPSLSNQADSTYVNLLTGSSVGNAAGPLSATFDLTRRQYNPVFEWIMMTGPVAADIQNMKFWLGLFQQAPTNVATLAGSTAAVAFRFVDGTDTNWMGVCNDGTTQAAAVSTGVAVAANTRYKFRIRIETTPGIAYFSVNDSSEVTISVNLPSASQNLGYALYALTNTGSGKNFLFSRAMCTFS